MGRNESTRSHGDSHAHDGHGHGHDHGGDTTSSRKLAAVSLINVVGFVVELAGGLAFGSVALISDAVHMLFDALAYVMAFAAAYVAERYGDGDRWSYGLHRLEPFAAFLNGLLLLPMVGFILWESVQRFLDPIAIGTGPTIAIAIGGLLVNVGSVVVLHGDAMSLNEKGAFYHLLGDAGGSVAVIVSVLAVEVTGLRAIDPITAALIAAVVAWSAITVLRGSGEIFFLKTPLESGVIRTHLTTIEGVDRVADFHAWQICSQITVATVHVETGVETMAEAETVVGRVHDELDRHGVDHATVELSPRYADRDVHLDTHCH
ncbi:MULTISPECIES: cation diffusion facilitator family transporter [Natrinema]|uniref:Cation diffusion facilitator family transporter n=1 Tax=Natrinema gari JCM 14663 TaxID=1230459 RepID=L9YVW0_9EURY|nr:MULTISPECIES: cation diffusion facilitator family transporter [Natrinema]AFO59348.1 cation diffusion facilitator family transporter [Natrinema sp. J7-2]ELY77816.1 cation diffusion facilitator family transporter [Natrinema gari JCM 14663]